LVTNGETGLLGLAFHPDYAANGKFYVYASAPGGEANHLSQVIQYSVRKDSTLPPAADPDSRQLVMSFEQPFSNHNAGWIGFNPQADDAQRSYLHIATGDGGGSRDVGNNAQNINNLLGSMLRVDVDGDDFASPERNYAIPPSNPFVGGEGADEIWAYGLRNPYRNSFDRDTGDLWIGDVGQDDREEIDFLAAGQPGGANFGWRVMEGDACFDDSQEQNNPPCFASNLASPVYDYEHGREAFQGESVTGGYLYRGAISDFQGHYFFADFVSHNIWTLDPYSSTPAVTNVTDRLRVNGNSSSPQGIASFAEDAAGELYILSFSGGNLFRIESSSRESRWRGQDADSGEPGDGASWTDPRNWVREGVADVEFVAGDHVFFGDGEGAKDLALTGAERVAAVTFTSSFDLNVLDGAELTVASGNVVVVGGATARVAGNLHAETSLHSIRKLGAGRLELSTASEFAVLEGTGTVGSDLVGLKIAGGGVYERAASSSPQTIGFLDAAADSRLRLAPAAPGQVADVLLHVQQANIEGDLDIARPEGYADPSIRGTYDVFPLFTVETATGAFAEAAFGEAIVGHQGNGLFYLLETDGGATSLISYLALPGDTDGDRLVGFADFLRFAANFSLLGDWTQGDFNGNGEVDFADFLTFGNNFEAVARPRMVAAIREPGNQSLAIGGLAVLSRSLRQRRRDRARAKSSRTHSVI
jgi:glucose/arabinose dehydrogenase